MANELKYKLAPTASRMLLLPVVLPSGVAPQFRTMDTSIASGIVSNPGPTSTGNIKSGSIVYFKNSDATVFLDGEQQLIMIKEADIISQQEVIINTPNVRPNANPINPYDMGKMAPPGTFLDRKQYQ